MLSDDLKQCPKCKRLLPPSEFYGRSTSTRYNCCKTCFNELATMRLRAVKQQAVDYKGGKCMVCGYARCIAALEFYHVSKDGKDFNISHKCLSFEKLMTELDKCILVCSNCHREIHAGLWPLID